MSLSALAVRIINAQFDEGKKKHRHLGMRAPDEWTREIDCIDCGKTLRAYFIEGDEDRPDRWSRWEKYCDAPAIETTKGNA